jgi:Lsr2
MSAMAKKTIVREEFTDDIDGGKAEGTVSFSFDGTAYEIDLSKKNRSALDKALKPYLDAARRVKGPRGRRGRATPARSNGSSARRSDLSSIRAWARTQGLTVADRGRIPADVIAAYEGQ